MAGTNRKNNLFFFDVIIILNKPQLPENIGMVARTMVNFGFKNLRIVNPKIKWPNKKSIAASAGAFEKISMYTKVFTNLKDAIQDINLLYAATIRTRDIEKKIISPKHAIREIKINRDDKKVGFLFGGEKAGLSNEDVSEASMIIKIPTNIGFGSLNLAMAVNIICYEWFILNSKTKKCKKINIKNNLANKGKINYFTNNLLSILDKIGFYKSFKKKEKLILNVKNLISNRRFSEKDLKILHGIIKALLNYKN